MGFCALGLGFMKKKNNRKMGMGFQFEQHRLGLWGLSWDLKKTISWEMGLGPPPFTTLVIDWEEILLIVSYHVEVAIQRNQPNKQHTHTKSVSRQT